MLKVLKMVRIGISCWYILKKNVKILNFRVKKRPKNDKDKRECDKLLSSGNLERVMWSSAYRATSTYVGGHVVSLYSLMFYVPL